MKDNEYIQYLEENFPFPITSETLTELKQLVNIDILEEVYVPKSELTNRLIDAIYKCSDINKKYMELLHENNFDFIYKDCNPHFEYSNYTTENIKKYPSPYPDFIGTDYVKLSELYLFNKSKELLDTYGRAKEFKLFQAHCFYEAENYLQSALFDIMNNILISFDVLKNKKLSLDKGNAGEHYVSQELDLFKYKYKFVENIILPYSDLKGKTSETDLYVLTPKGILVCEIKNKGNEKYVFKISSDGQWSKYNSQGKFLEVMDSPFAQNTRHCIATEQFLKDNGITDFKIIPVVIIANESVRIEKDSENIVIRASELYNLVEGLELPEKYNEEYQTKVLNILKDKSIKKENLFKVLSVKDDAEEKIINSTSRILDMYIDFINHKYNVLHDGLLRNSKIHFKRLKRMRIFYGICILFGIYSLVRIFTGHFSLMCLLPFFLLYLFASEIVDV